jgi:hypothetical protein
MNILLSIVGLIAGGIIGFSFGVIQDKALKQNEQRQRTGVVKSIWTMIPGSGVRTAYLLIVLLIVQITCPLFFDGHIEWIVSAGVALGYAWTLTQQLRRKILAK